MKYCAEITVKVNIIADDSQQALAKAASIADACVVHGNMISPADRQVKWAHTHSVTWKGND